MFRGAEKKSIEIRRVARLLLTRSFPSSRSLSLLLRYTATANSLLFMGSAYNNPTYTLYQREQYGSFDFSLATFLSFRRDFELISIPLLLLLFLLRLFSPSSDASEPFAMFWYEPSTVGAFWDGLALDHHFDSGSDDWASMRSTWTDNKGLYVAMKAGNMTGHQTHGDIVSFASSFS